MRELKSEELQAVSGGTFCLFGGLLTSLFSSWSCKPATTTVSSSSCQPAAPAPAPAPSYSYSYSSCQPAQPVYQSRC